MASGMNKRILKEFTDAQSTANAASLPGTTISMVNDDLYNWIALMPAPAESMYSGATYSLKIELPKEYPFKPPKITFSNRIYHPNVTNEAPGLVCLAMLRGDEWKPPNKVVEVLVKIRGLLLAPDPDDAVEATIADQFKSDPAAFAAMAKEFVKKYGSPTKTGPAK